jgi:hypothetical protein
LGLTAQLLRGIALPGWRYLNWGGGGGGARQPRVFLKHQLSLAAGRWRWRWDGFAARVQGAKAQRSTAQRYSGTIPRVFGHGDGSRWPGLDAARTHLQGKTLFRCLFLFPSSDGALGVVSCSGHTRPSGADEVAGGRRAAGGRSSQLGGRNALQQSGCGADRFGVRVTESICLSRPLCRSGLISLSVHIPVVGLGLIAELPLIAHHTVFTTPPPPPPLSLSLLFTLFIRRMRMRPARSTARNELPRSRRSLVGLRTHARTPSREPWSAASI